MNIAYFIEDFPPGTRSSIGTYGLEMTKKLVQMDITPTIFTRNRGSDPISDVWNGMQIHRPYLVDIRDTLSILAPLDVQRWSPADQQFFLDMVLFNQIAAQHLVVHLVQGKGKKYPLVVSHNWLTALAGMIIHRELGVPFVFHLYSTERGRTKLRSPVVEMIEERAAAVADTIITVSDAMRNELVESGVPSGKIRLVYNGVDPEKFNPGRILPDEIARFRKEISPQQQRIILYVGSLNQNKGVDSLVRSMAEIIPHSPDIRLIILGAGEMEKELTDMVASLHLSGQVVIQNRYLSEHERLLYYASADLVVIPSRYQPFSLVAAEAMAMAKPLVVGASGTNGMREQVIHEGPKQCGYHVNPDDPSDIARHILCLLSDPEKMKKFGEEGRKRVLSLFTWERAAGITADLYRQAVQNN